MPKYLVSFIRSTTDVADVAIDAESPEAAQEAAADVLKALPATWRIVSQSPTVRGVWLDEHGPMVAGDTILLRWLKERS